MLPLIETIELARYRGFRDRHEQGLSRLTLVYGENSSGKSALIRIPAVLAESRTSGRPGINLDAAGKILISGNIYSGGNPVMTVMRFLPNGTLDPTFASGGVSPRWSTRHALTNRGSPGGPAAPQRRAGAARRSFSPSA